MSQEMGEIAGQNDSSDATNGGNPIPVVEVEVPQKGKRARRASTKPERVSKVPNIPGRRSSIYRGVTRHRWTGRYEAHLWDKSCWNQTQNKKGRQVYLGAYDEEEAAARAYDLAALKYWGPVTVINFPLPDYTRELEEMGKVTKEEYLASLRRKSSGFSRGVSKYRGVARHHHNGRWEARIGRIFGNKYLYLGTYSTQEEAAAAYDLAAIEYRGLNAVTNFDLSRYISWLRPGQDNKIAANSSASGKTGMTLVSSSQIQHDSILPVAPTMEAADSQIEQTGMWDVTQSIASGHHQLTSSSAQNTNSPGSALGLLSQSSIFRKMLNKANLTEYGVTDSNQIDNYNKIVVQRNANSDGDVKWELRFQAEAEHVFNHPEMNLLDQPEDMSFGASSVLDRMFYPSDMSFEYQPINGYAGAAHAEMDQGDVLSESVISPLTALSSPYTINTISCSEQLRVGHTLSQRTTLET